MRSSKGHSKLRGSELCIPQADTRGIALSVQAIEGNALDAIIVLELGRIEVECKPGGKIDVKGVAFKQRRVENTLDVERGRQLHRNFLDGACSSKLSQALIKGKALGGYRERAGIVRPVARDHVNGILVVRSVLVGGGGVVGSV